MGDKVKVPSRVIGVGEGIRMIRYDIKRVSPSEFVGCRGLWFAAINGLSPLEFMLLLWCIRKMDGSNEVCLSKSWCYDKIYNVGKFRYSYSSFRNAIGSMVKKDLLKRLGAAYFMVNPTIAIKSGAWQRDVAYKKYFGGDVDIFENV